MSSGILVICLGGPCPHPPFLVQRVRSGFLNSPCERATDVEAPNRSSFYSVPDRMWAGVWVNSVCSRAINEVDEKKQNHAHALGSQPTTTFLTVTVRTRAKVLCPTVQCHNGDVLQRGEGW
ncbi:hypothetical protein NPIL_91341 [Nephila pilipes]|uniref:Uncharacterized protein n=1 Tax=Nephila pilipes TaxID=299642 RepID=A0A8X6NX53_NEPPI|nr:hypothetical protein NPIL_91341 [Nephila pilipes]